MTNVIFDNPLGTSENYSSIYLNDAIAIGESYNIDYTDGDPSVIPVGYFSFRNKWVDFENLSGNPIIDEFAMGWDNSELVGYDEDAFETWKGSDLLNFSRATEMILLAGENLVYGSDINLMNKIKDATIKEETEMRKFHDMEKNLINQSGIKSFPYAYEGGVCHLTKKPYTKKQISDYNKYMAQVEEYKKTNAEYLSFNKKKFKLWREQADVRHNLSSEMAEKDAKNFLEDNKGKFIFIISYSDNDGSKGTVMEHGDIFKNVSHVRISHH
jgi:hypothetical protein